MQQLAVVRDMDGAIKDGHVPPPPSAADPEQGQIAHVPPLDLQLRGRRVAKVDTGSAETGSPGSSGGRRRSAKSASMQGKSTRSSETSPFHGDSVEHESLVAGAAPNDGFDGVIHAVCCSALCCVLQR